MRPSQISEHLLPAERRVWRDIQAFEERGPGGGLGRLASAPLQALVPDRLREALQEGMGSFLDVARQTSAFGASPESVLAREGITMAELRDHASLERVAELQQKEVRPAVLTASLQGAGLGVGGVVLAAADVPLLLTAHLRLLVRLGFCTGLDLRSLEERRYLLGLLELGYCLQDREERRQSLEGLAELALEQEATAERPPPDLTLNLLQRSVGTFVEKILPVLLRRRAGAALPLLGSALGAGANYALTRDVVEGARHLLLKRLLVHRALRRSRS